jgi:hypothetical protein
LSPSRYCCRSNLCSQNSKILHGNLWVNYQTWIWW